MGLFPLVPGVLFYGLEYLYNYELGNQEDGVGVNYCTVRRAVRLEVGA